MELLTFDKTLIRCSSLACLFTEPQSKADREAGRLSKTAQSHLVQAYMKERWDIDTELDNKFVRKGNLAEEEALTLIARVDGRYYEKNTERRSDGYITGEPDIVDEIIVDAKNSWSAATFLAKLTEEVDKTYYYQMQGYMKLFDRDRAKISYCLVTTPESLRNDEKYKLLRKMEAATEENPEFKAAWEKLERSMVFDHIPIKERVINVYVDRDNSVIDRIPEKVEKARLFLAELQDKHLNQ